MFYVLCGLGLPSLVPHTLSPPHTLTHTMSQSQEEFLKGRIKVNGKTGSLGDDITLSREKNMITVVSGIPLSKRCACVRVFVLLVCACVL